MIQGSDEWKAARLGKITGSRFADVMAGKRGKFSKAADDYMMELIGEILTGVSADEINSRATNWGNMHEPNARMWYICESGETLQETGVIDHPTIPGVACSPDALVGDDGILEIKCPYTTRALGSCMLPQLVARELISSADTPVRISPINSIM